MDTTKHSPTPWTTADGVVTDANGLAVCSLHDHVPADQEEEEAKGVDLFKANAARITSCVNACEKIKEPEKAVLEAVQALQQAQIFIDRAGSIGERMAYKRVVFALRTLGVEA